MQLSGSFALPGWEMSSSTYMELTEPPTIAPPQQSLVLVIIIAIL